MYTPQTVINLFCFVAFFVAKWDLRNIYPLFADKWFIDRKTSIISLELKALK